MPAFFLSLLACSIAMLGGRDAIRIARLSASLGASGGLYFSILIASTASCAVAAWLGSLLAPSMPGDGKLVFVAIALCLAALEIAIRRPPPAPREPTRSSGAILLVLFASQLTDGARFLVLALAMLTGDPAQAAAGGAVGTAAVACLAAATGKDWESHSYGPALRWGTVMLCMIAGAIVLVNGLRLV